MDTLDKIIGSFTYECEVGFHEEEKGLLQKITIDFTAYVTPMVPHEREGEGAVRMDYSRANSLLMGFFKGRKYKLLETILEDVALLLMKNFPIHGVEVSVTKHPLGMPNAHSVSYAGYRGGAL